MGPIPLETLADRAGARDREQMAVADALLRKSTLDIVGTAADEAAGKIAISIKIKEHLFLRREGNRGAVGRTANAAHDIAGHNQRLLATVRQSEHNHGIG